MEHVQSHQSQVDAHVSEMAERKFAKMERQHNKAMREAAKEAKTIGYDGEKVPF